MEFFADTYPKPWEIPADARAVLVFLEDTHPPRYEFVCMVTGAGTLAEVKDGLGAQFPQLDGRPVLITSVGGNSSRVRRLQVSEQITRAVVEEAVAAPSDMSGTALQAP